jgi:hypothetical protein
MDGTLFLLGLLGLLTLGTLLTEKAILYLLLALFAVPVGFALAYAGALDLLRSLIPLVCVVG